MRYLSTFSEVQYEANFVRYDINKIMFFSTQTVLDRGYCKTTCRVYAAWLHLARPNIVLGKSPRNVIEKEEQYQIHFFSLSYLLHTYHFNSCFGNSVVMTVKKLDTSQISATLFPATILATIHYYSLQPKTAVFDL